MKVINDDDFDDHDDDERKNPKKQSLSQMIDQVMTINSVQKSSKLELSSWGKRPFKVVLCTAARHYPPSDTSRVLFFYKYTPMRN